MRTGFATRAPLVIAHRGASAYAPENTEAAFDLALAQDGDGVELDVRMTRDGRFVVWHDETLQRTARIEGAIRMGRVSATSYAELRRCDIGSWFNDTRPTLARREYAGLRVLTLDQVLSRFNARTSLFVHVKDRLTPVDAARFAHSFRRGRRHRHTVLSFDAPTLQRLRRLGARTALVQLVRRVLPGAGAVRWEMWRRYADGVSPRCDLIACEHIAAAHAQGLTFIPHTVNDVEQMRSLLEWGADGIISDTPDVLRTEVTRMQMREIATSREAGRSPAATGEVLVAPGPSLPSTA